VNEKIKRYKKIYDLRFTIYDLPWHKPLQINFLRLINRAFLYIERRLFLSLFHGSRPTATSHL